MSVFIDEPFDGTGPLTAPWTAHSELTIEDGTSSSGELTDTDQVDGELTTSNPILLEHSTMPPSLDYGAEVTIAINAGVEASVYAYVFLRAEESVSESPDLNGIMAWFVLEGTTARVRVYEDEDRAESALDNSTLELSAGEQDVAFRVEVEGDVLRTYVNDTLLNTFVYSSSTFDTGTRLIWRVWDDESHVTRFRASTLPFGGVSEFWTSFVKSHEAIS